MPRHVGVSCFVDHDLSVNGEELMIMKRQHLCFTTFALYLSVRICLFAAKDHTTYVLTVNDLKSSSHPQANVTFDGGKQCKVLHTLTATLRRASIEHTAPDASADLDLVLESARVYQRLDPA
jgi:hypothetical protein